MPTFEEMWNEVLDSVPQLNQYLAKRFVNRAFRDIRQGRSWAFLTEEAFLAVPDEITTGTASVTQFSKTVNMSAAAQAVLDVLDLNIPIDQRQFRVGSGILYPITDYTAGVLTLGTAYQGDTSAAATYSIYRAYFTPPTDFLSWTVVKDIENGRRLRLNATREDLDRLDPQRTNTGNPYYLAAHKATSNLPLYELWPHLKSAKALYCKYQRSGVDLVVGDNLPTSIPESAVIAKALSYACKWANQQKGRFEELKGVDWLGTAREHERSAIMELEKAKVQDEETFVENISYAPEYQSRYPMDSNFLQKHDWGE